MKRTTILVLGLVLFAAPAFAQKVAIDYDHQFDFDKVKTFQYVETKESEPADPLMDERIEAAIMRTLTEGGLTQVDSDPDLFVTYHMTTEDYKVLSTTSFGYGGYGAGWHRWGGSMGTATTTEYNYTEGTLVIDAYEPAEKKMVWRGSGTVTLKAKPERRTRQIDKILKKMGHRWKKILAKQGK